MNEWDSVAWEEMKSQIIGQKLLVKKFTQNKNTF